jgi:hypothetical protein
MYQNLHEYVDSAFAFASASASASAPLFYYFTLLLQNKIN